MCKLVGDFKNKTTISIKLQNYDLTFKIIKNNWIKNSMQRESIQLDTYIKS